jgi:uncharacterized sporulation protein YeaH/YhbH (DUF444 family)
MENNCIISRENWSLHRKGELDQQRHNEKVKEAIKNNLPDVISEESIIMSNGKKIIRLPIRSLDEYRFRFNYNKQKHAGQGQGGTKPGDVLDVGRDSKSGLGPGAGSDPGVDYYEADISFEELEEMVFEDFSLLLYSKYHYKHFPVAGSLYFFYWKYGRNQCVHELPKQHPTVSLLQSVHTEIHIP